MKKCQKDVKSNSFKKKKSPQGKAVLLLERSATGPVLFSNFKLENFSEINLGKKNK